MFDAELGAALADERARQEAFVELIASENYVSPRVLEALGSTLTNKYADGYPGRRAYRGCEAVDVAETLAVERACRLFGATYANVQPYSGSIANLAVLHALMRPGETLLGMDAGHGGHVTHGGARNVSGVVFDSAQYGIAATDGRIDYGAVETLARKHKPRVIIAGASAYSRIVDWEAFRTIADAVGARLVADIAHVAGLIAAGLYPNPIGTADVVTTTTHKTLRGPRGGMILAAEQLRAEKGVEPIFPAQASVSSSARLGKIGSTPFSAGRDGDSEARAEIIGSTPFSGVCEALDAAVWPGIQGGPLMHVIAAKAVAFAEALEPEFTEYQTRVVANARRLADRLSRRGLAVVTGGTDTHMLLVDLDGAALEAGEAEAALEAAQIAVNAVRRPRSGAGGEASLSALRLGTPAVTTRGFGTAEIDALADWIADIVETRAAEATIARVRREVAETCARLPVYAEAE